MAVSRPLSIDCPGRGPVVLMSRSRPLSRLSETQQSRGGWVSTARDRPALAGSGSTAACRGRCQWLQDVQPAPRRSARGRPCRRARSMADWQDLLVDGVSQTTSTSFLRLFTYRRDDTVGTTTTNRIIAAPLFRGGEVSGLVHMETR